MAFPVPPVAAGKKQVVVLRITLVKAAVLQRVAPKLKEKMEKAIILQSVISCPNCGHQEEETMPTDACQFFYECKNCKTILRPKEGDCCVFCSYGTVACPPIQDNQSCCG